MTNWIKRNLPELDDWYLASEGDDSSDDEIAYLFNDIGPLIYVQGLARPIDQIIPE